MKGVAISQTPKKFVVFGIKVYTPGAVTDDGQDGGESTWFSPKQLVAAQDQFNHELWMTQGSDYQENIFSIQKFPTWTIEIDFENPELTQNYLVELTDGVEKQCPVGKAFGVEGIGEGIVWRCISKAEIKTSDLIFKVKGAKHSDTKVKTTANVDVEKVQNIKQFAENVVTDHRAEKMLEKMKEAGIAILAENTGHFLKLMGSDVIKEESDTIEASGLDRKEVMPAVNKLSGQWFLKFLKGNLDV
jgi:hypothetical protein